MLFKAYFFKTVVPCKRKIVFSMNSKLHFATKTNKLPFENCASSNLQEDVKVSGYRL